MKTINLRLFGLIALALVACLGSFAQSVSGDLMGTIFDASGAGIPNATVVGKNDATGVESTTKSAATGEYHLSNLPAGTYTLTVTAPGFTKAQLRAVAVTLNKTATTNFKLDVGTNVETVEVSAAAATIDTTTASVQTSFETRTLTDLPTASGGSGVINLSLLNAGVGSSGAVGLGSGPSVGGQRPRNNNFTIEGIDNNSGSVTGPLVKVPNDAVAEFSVQQNQFSPEFGHSSGGQFNQVVKSGGNELHGEAYEYLENRNLNAADNHRPSTATNCTRATTTTASAAHWAARSRKTSCSSMVCTSTTRSARSSTPGALFAPTAAGWATICGFVPGSTRPT